MSRLLCIVLPITFRQSSSGAKSYKINITQCTSTCKISRNLVTCLKFWKDGSQKFCQGSEDLTMRVWDVRIISNQSAHASCSLTFGKYVYFPLDADVSSCGTYVISGSKGFDGNGCEGRIWDMRSPATPLFFLEGHEQDTVGCCFIGCVPGWHENKLICTVSKDCTVKIWNAENGSCLCTHEEEGSGTWTSVRAWQEQGEEAEAGAGGNISTWGEEKPHIVATTYFGGVYIFSVITADGGEKVKLKAINMVSPVQEE